METLRYFEVRGKMCRLLGFEPHLAKGGVNSSVSDLNSSKYNASAISSMSKYSEMMSLPDNSFSDCNLFVKCIDKSLNSKDLYEIFKKFGEVKSAKVSIHPDHTSKGYGFVWFLEESSAKLALNASK